MKIKCERCNSLFIPTQEEKNRIHEAIKNGTQLLVLICSNCKQHTSWKSDDFDASTIKDFRILRCPVGQCHGWVEQVEMNKLFECFTCGSVWKERRSIDDEVRGMIEKYDYRNEVYILSQEGHFVSDPYANLNSNYYSNVSNEEEGIGKSYRRD